MFNLFYGKLALPAALNLIKRQTLFIVSNKYFTAILIKQNLLNESLFSVVYNYTQKHAMQKINVDVCNKFVEKVKLS